MDSEADNNLVWPAHILTFSASTEKELERFISKCISYMKQDNFKQMDFKVFSQAINHFPPPLNSHYRVAVVGKKANDILHKLEKRSYFKRKIANGTTPPKLCFLFPGYGSCTYKMGQQLYSNIQVFHDFMLEAEDAVRSELPNISILDALYGRDRSLVDHPIYSLIPQVYLTYGICRIWENWGIQPDYVLGHSMGEYVAAASANINNMIPDVVNMSAWFSSSLEKINDGEMTVVVQEEDMISGLIEQEGDDNAGEWLEFSSHNTKHQHVIGGTSKAMQGFKETCKNLKIPCFEMALKKPFHTRGVIPSLKALKETVEKFEYKAPTCKYVSSCSGRIEESLSADYWVNHFRQPVNFKGAAETVVAEGVKVFLEIGAKTPLGTMIKENMEIDPKLKKEIEAGEYHWLPSITSSGDEFETVLSTLAQLFVLGFPVKWNGLYGQYKLKHFDTTWLHDHNRKDLVEEFLTDLENEIHEVKYWN